MSELDPAAFADLLAGYCLEVQARETVLVRSTSLAAPLLLELQSAILERDAWPLLRVELPGQTPAFYEHARERHLDDYPDLALTEAKGSTRCWASRHPPTSASSSTSTPTGSRATPARGGRSARRR